MTTADVPRPLDIDLGVSQSVDPRVMQLQRVIGWIVAGALLGPSAIVVLVFALLGATPLWVKALLAVAWMLLAALLVWLAERWPAIEYRHTSYTVDHQGIEIRSGVVWRSVTSVPKTRVQHTDVSQGPLQRRYGLGTLVMHTAGTEHALVGLPGLDYRVAVALRDHLLPRGAGDAV
jgi:uncharacterized protein